MKKTKKPRKAVNGGDDDDKKKKQEEAGATDRMVDAGEYDLGDEGVKFGEGHAVKNEEL